MSITARELAKDLIPKKESPKDSRALAQSLLKGEAKAAQETLGADFDPETTASAGLRIYLSRGDNLAEKNARMKKRFPDGEVKVMPESVVLGFNDDTLVWRESPQAQWKLVEPPGFDMTDIAEAVAPSAESIAFEGAMAIGSSGASVPATIGRQIFGALFGESVEQIGQSISGTQKQGPAGVAGEIGFEGGMSAVGGFAVSPLVGLKNAAVGAGALRVGPEGVDTLKAANRLDPKGPDSGVALGDLTPGMVSDNPAIRLSESQSAVLLPGLRRRYRALAERLNEMVSSSVDDKAIGETIVNTKDALDTLSKDFVRRGGAPNTTKSEGGRALQAGIAEYDKVSDGIVGSLYDAARAIEEPTFDLAPTLSLAEDLVKGKKGKIDPKVAAVIDQIEAIKGPIQLNSGETLSVTDQIRNARTELFSLKSVKPGEVKNQATGQANDLFMSLTEQLKNPKNTSAAFRKAWDAANEGAAIRFDTLSKSAIIDAAKSQSPAKLVSTYAAPGMVDELKVLRSTIHPLKWRTFVDSFYADLAANPATLAKRLDSFDKETLDALMPRTEQVLWKKIGKEMTRIQKVGVDDIAETQIRNKNFVNELITSANPRKVNMLMRAANHTHNKEMRRSLRSAILEWTWDGIVSPGKNTLKVEEKLLKTRVDHLKTSGMWRFLSEPERQIIGDAQVVSRAFSMIADAGTSIQGAEAVSGLKQLQASAIMTFVRGEIVAQFYMSAFGRRMLLGSGMPHSNGALLRVMGGALAQISPPEDLSKLAEEQD